MTRSNPLLQLASPLAAILALLFLWCRLIYHLHWEWSINPQYQYGWAVPFLCLYLAWHRARQDLSPPVPHPAPAPRWIHFTAAALLALLWPATRLLQEANPEWRLVSWALALEVLGLTLVLTDLYPGPCLAGHPIRISNLIFPLGFILVAVPWPSLLEGPLIQALTRATAALTTEALNLAGTPAMQHGSLVEVSRGVMGIEEACCGIRSFQAALMLALFFGGLYRLGILHRLRLVIAGLSLAFGFNLLRTFLLGSIAANYGPTATNAWHTPLGCLMPLACFLGLALLVRTPAGSRKHSSGHLVERFQNCALPQNPPRRIARRSEWIGVALLTWTVATELGTELWYRAHASKLPVPLTWNIALPRDAAAIQQGFLSPKAKQLLRFDQGFEATWQDDAAHTWQVIFLCWHPGRVAARLAKDHTPAICLSAGGRKLLTEPKTLDVTIEALRLRVHTYVASDDLHGKVHVLYCIREDSAVEEIDLAPSTLWQERLLPVLRGRRNRGQRSLELAVWGLDQDEVARTALIEQLRRIVRIDI